MQMKVIKPRDCTINHAFGALLAGDKCFGLQDACPACKTVWTSEGDNVTPCNTKMGADERGGGEEP